jgi:hypothetical protein
MHDLINVLLVSQERYLSNNTKYFSGISLCSNVLRVDFWQGGCGLSGVIFEEIKGMLESV